MKTNYQNQVEEIKSLINSIRSKSEVFAERAKHPYYEDLLKVISDLKEINNFLN